MKGVGWWFSFLLFSVKYVWNQLAFWCMNFMRFFMVFIWMCRLVTYERINNLSSNHPFYAQLYHAKLSPICHRRPCVITTLDLCRPSSLHLYIQIIILGHPCIIHSTCHHQWPNAQNLWNDSCITTRPLFIVQQMVVELNLYVEFVYNDSDVKNSTNMDKHYNLS